MGSTVRSLLGKEISAKVVPAVPKLNESIKEGNVKIDPEEEVIMSEKLQESEDFDFVDQYSDAEEESSPSLLAENSADSALNCAFVGVGAGGCRIAQAFLELGFNRTLLVNTTEKDFDSNAPAENQVVIPGSDGIAKDVSKGKKILRNNGTVVEDALRTKIGKVDWLFVCAGGGGGTGSSVFALNSVFEQHLASSGGEGRIVYIVSSPTAQEKLNQTIKENSLSLIQEVSESPHLVIDNEKQFNIFRNKTGLRGMFRSANTAFAKMFWQVLKLASESSPIQTFDGQDLARLLRCTGRMVVGHSIAEPSPDMGNQLFSSCLNSSPCATLEGKPEAGVLLHIVPESMADDPDLVMHLDAAASYLGSRTRTLFRGIYIKSSVDRLITILAIAGVSGE